MGAARRGALPDGDTGGAAGPAAGAGGGPFALTPARIPLDLAAAVALALGVYWLDGWAARVAALAVMAVAVAAGVTALKLIDLPAIDRAYSARPLWREIASHATACASRACTGPGATD